MALNGVKALRLSTIDCWNSNRADCIRIFDDMLWFFYFIPLAIFTGIMGTWRNLVHKYPVLFEPPYNQYIGVGSDLPYFLGCAILGGTLLFVYPHHRWLKSYPLWSLAVAVFKLGIVVAFILSIYFQSQFLPRPLGKCQNLDVWRGSAPANGAMSMWDLLPTTTRRPGGRRKRRKSPCGTITTLWRFEIALAFLLGISAILAFLVFLYHVFPGNGHRGSSKASANKNRFWLGRNQRKERTPEDPIDTPTQALLSNKQGRDQPPSYEDIGYEIPTVSGPSGTMSKASKDERR